MSNLDVLNDRGPGVWPWILGLAVVAVLVWALIEMFDVTRDPVSVTSTDTVVEADGMTPVPPVGPATPGEAVTPVGAGEPPSAAPDTSLVSAQP